jgi:hypothetical protein
MNDEMVRLLRDAKLRESIVLSAKTKPDINDYCINFGSTGGRYDRRFGCRDEIELVIPAESLSIIGISIMIFSLDYNKEVLRVEGGRGVVERLFIRVDESSSDLCQIELTGINWSSTDDFFQFLDPSVCVSAFLDRNEEGVSERALAITGSRVSLANLGALFLNASIKEERFVRFAEPRFSGFQKVNAFPLVCDSCDLIISICEPYDR